MRREASLKNEEMVKTIEDSVRVERPSSLNRINPYKAGIGGSYNEFLGHKRSTRTLKG